MKTAAIDGARFVRYWDKSVSALKHAPSILDGNPLMPNDRLFSALGTRRNRHTFLRTEKMLNIFKGAIFDIQTNRDGLFNGLIKQPMTDEGVDKAFKKSKGKTSKDTLRFENIRMVSNHLQASPCHTAIRAYAAEHMHRPLQCGIISITRMF